MTDDLKPLAQTLRESLRYATKEAHRRIDHHPLMAPLVKSKVRFGHYVLVLQTFHALYQSLHIELEKAMHTHRVDLLYRPSPRVEWLDRDLADFGLRPFPMLRSPALPVQASLASPAAIVGSLYVIEGSTLGGQVIARQLKSSIGVTAELGGRFFNGHGQATAARWDDFWIFAEKLCSYNDIPIACHAATELFKFIEDVFDATLAPPFGRFTESLDHA